MYNDERYSLSRYSVNRSEKTVAVSAGFAEALGAAAGAAVPVNIRGSYTEACQGSVRGTVSLVTNFSALEDLTAAARMSADVLVRTALAERVQSGACARKNIPAALGALEGLLTDAWAGKDVPARLTLTERLESLTAVSKDICGVMSAFEVLTSLLEATSQTTERAVFQLTIPPGGELRIDSGLFLVLLNGENALHTQFGDWVDVSRELLRLNIESASGGGLEGQMIYTERFL